MSLKSPEQEVGYCICRVMYCLYCVFVSFRLCIFILIFTCVRTTATQWKPKCSK